MLRFLIVYYASPDGKDKIENLTYVREKFLSNMVEGEDYVLSKYCYTGSSIAGDLDVDVIFSGIGPTIGARNVLGHNYEKFSQTDTDKFIVYYSLTDDSVKLNNFGVPESYMSAEYENLREQMIKTFNRYVYGPHINGFRESHEQTLREMWQNINLLDEEKSQISNRMFDEFIIRNFAKNTLLMRSLLLSQDRESVNYSLRTLIVGIIDGIKKNDAFKIPIELTDFGPCFDESLPENQEIIKLVNVYNVLNSPSHKIK